MDPKDIIESSISVFEKYAAWRQLKKDKGAILRLLYLESKRNLSLLSCIKDKPTTKGSEHLTSHYHGIIAAMETEILELIFMAGKSNTKVFDVMSDSSDFEIDDDDSEIAYSDTPLNSLSFLYVKIWTLKKLITLDKNSVIKKINYSTRLKNIRSAYLSLIFAMEKLSEIVLLSKN